MSMLMDQNKRKFKISYNLGQIVKIIEIMNNQFKGTKLHF